MPLSELPEPQDCQIWLDFDGTITKQDVLDELIQRYSADDSWRIVEDKWQAGLIGSQECLQAQFALLRISPTDLNKALDRIEIDKGIFDLLRFAQSQDVPVAILSDNTESAIRHILTYNGIVVDFPVKANAVEHHGLHLKLLCPNGSCDCQTNAAHCKCASAQALGDPGRKSIYIGDGRSDLCPARKMDWIFAKNTLAACLEKESIPFTRFKTLHDVTRFLSAAWLDGEPLLAAQDNLSE